MKQFTQTPTQTIPETKPAEPTQTEPAQPAQHAADCRHSCDCDRAHKHEPRRQLEIRPWFDPIGDPYGHRPDSAYVELFWLPFLGPTSTLFLRRTAVLLKPGGDGIKIFKKQLARELGLGTWRGQESPLNKAIDRCRDFNLVVVSNEYEIYVRQFIPGLPKRLVNRLSGPLRKAHLLGEKKNSDGGDLDYGIDADAYPTSETVGDEEETDVLETAVSETRADETTDADSSAEESFTSGIFSSAKPPMRGQPPEIQLLMPTYYAEVQAESELREEEPDETKPITPAADSTADTPAEPPAPGRSPR